ncbi:unnamed protein product, partial [Polarella glacialis]
MKMFSPVVIPIVQLLKNQDPGKDAQLAEQLSACLEKFVLRLGTESGFCVGSVCTLADVHAVPFLWRFGFLVKHFRGYDIFQAHPRLALLAKSFEEMPEFQAVMKREGLTKEKLIPMYALYANDSRWSEDGTVMVGRGKSTSRASSEAREASEAKKASQESRRLAAEAAAAASAAETAKAAEVSAAARLRSFDAEQEVSTKGEGKGKLKGKKAACPNVHLDTRVAEDVIVFPGLSDEELGKVIASLLASRLVLLVRGAFHAWQHACNGEDPEKAAEELGALRRQVSDAAAAKVTAVAAREEGQAALQSSQALAEQLSVSVDDLQKKVAALEAEARQAAQLRIELQKAEEEAREVKASQRDLRCTAAMLSRRERASRTVIASLMASHMELMLQGTFCAWRDALAGNQQAEAAAKLQLAFDGSKGDLETQALELAKLQKEVSEAAKLRQQLDETAIQAAAEAGALRAELAAGKAEDSEAAKLRQQLDETASQAAAEAAALRADLAAGKAEVSEAAKLRQQLDETASQAAAEAAALRADLAAGKAEAVAASTKSDELREECRALKSDASHLRQQIEDLEAQAAKASVVTEELAQARTEAASRSTQDARQEASRQACQVAVAEASVALLLKRERTLRHMVATLLATQLEQFLRGVWESWRSCCEGVAVSVE